MHTFSFLKPACSCLNLSSSEHTEATYHQVWWKSCSTKHLGLRVMLSLCSISKITTFIGSMTIIHSAQSSGIFFLHRCLWRDHVVWFSSSAWSLSTLMPFPILLPLTFLIQMVDQCLCLDIQVGCSLKFGSAQVFYPTCSLFHFSWNNVAFLS